MISNRILDGVVWPTTGVADPMRWYMQYHYFNPMRLNYIDGFTLLDIAMSDRSGRVLADPFTLNLPNNIGRQVLELLCTTP